MRGLQWLLVCAFICVQLKHSFSTVEIFFDSCVDNQDCPDHAVCASATPTTKKCRCESGYDAIDLPFTSAGSPVTVCRDLGPCSPFDSLETDCGTNGECVTYTNEYGVNAAFCKCRNGYSGIRCDGQGISTRNPYTTRPPYLETRRPGNIGSLLPIIGGGVLLLLLLAGGGAALASTSG